jgi:hypothetical protein
LGIALVDSDTDVLTNSKIHDQGQSLASEFSERVCLLLREMEVTHVSLPRGNGYVVGRQVFIKSYVAKGKTYLRCHQLKICSARALITPDGLAHHDDDDHDHQPPDIEVLQFYDDLYAKPADKANSKRTLRDMFDETRENFISASTGSTEEALVR